MPGPAAWLFLPGWLVPGRLHTQLLVAASGLRATPEPVSPRAGPGTALSRSQKDREAPAGCSAPGGRGPDPITARAQRARIAPKCDKVSGRRAGLALPNDLKSQPLGGLGFRKLLSGAHICSELPFARASQKLRIDTENILLTSLCSPGASCGPLTKTALSTGF